MVGKVCSTHQGGGGGKGRLSHPNAGSGERWSATVLSVSVRAGLSTRVWLVVAPVCVNLIYAMRGAEMREYGVWGQISWYRWQVAGIWCSEKEGVQVCRELCVKAGRVVNTMAVHRGREGGAGTSQQVPCSAVQESRHTGGGEPVPHGGRKEKGVIMVQANAHRCANNERTER